MSFITNDAVEAFVLPKCTRPAKAALDAWMVETNDQGAVSEPEGVVVPFAKEMDEWFGTPAWAR